MRRIRRRACGKADGKEDACLRELGSESCLWGFNSAGFPWRKEEGKVFDTWVADTEKGFRGLGPVLFLNLDHDRDPNAYPYPTHVK